MILQILLYPKKTAVIEGSQAQLAMLLESGAIQDLGNNTVQFTIPFKLALSKVGDKDLEEFIVSKWQVLFPKSKIQSTNITPYYVSGNTNHCIRYMKEFLQAHKSKYTLDCIYYATAAYLYEKSLNSFNGTSKNFNFIRRELENWCDEYIQNTDSVISKAKIYYERAVKSAKPKSGRNRPKLLNLFGEGVSGNGELSITEPTTDRRGISDTTEGELFDGDRYIQSEPIVAIKPTATRINNSHKR